MTVVGGAVTDERSGDQSTTELKAEALLSLSSIGHVVARRGPDRYALLPMSDVNERSALRCVCRLPLDQPTLPLGGGRPWSCVGLVVRKCRSLLQEGGHPIPDRAHPVTILSLHAQVIP